MGSIKTIPSSSPAEHAERPGLAYRLVDWTHGRWSLLLFAVLGLLGVGPIRAVHALRDARRAKVFRLLQSIEQPTLVVIGRDPLVS